MQQVQSDACFEHGKLWANCRDCQVLVRTHYSNGQIGALDVDTGEDTISDGDQGGPTDQMN